MARQRPIYFKDLAAFLVELRERSGWNQAQAAHIAKRRRLTAITRQVLLRMERGQIKTPEPDVLRDFARLYEVEYGEIAGLFIRERYGVRVVCNTEQIDGVTAAQHVALHAADSIEPASPSMLDSIGDAHDATATTTEVLAILIDTVLLLSEMSERLRPHARGQDPTALDAAALLPSRARSGSGRDAGKAGRGRRRTA